MGLLGVIGAGYCYLHQQFFNWASVPGARFSNPPTTPSPVR